MLDRKSFKKISSYFSRRKEVQCVYLFGSFASGKEKPDSDIDLGIVLQENVSQNKHTNLRLAFGIAMEQVLKNPVDIVILNSADTFLKHHVLKTGKRLYESKTRRGRNFEARALLEYFDFKPYYDIMMQGIMRKVRKG